MKKGVSVQFYINVRIYKIFISDISNEYILFSDKPKVLYSCIKELGIETSVYCKAVHIPISEWDKVKDIFKAIPITDSPWK